MKSTNVTAGKPKLSGSIFRAPLGTVLPTDSESALNAAFDEIGYCSDDGVTNDGSRESTKIKAWGGDTVLIVQTGKEDSFKMTWIEALNVDTLKAVHGEDNVSGSLSTGISIKANSKELDSASYVIDMVMRDDAIKRIVIPNAMISEVGEITYSDEDVVGYPVTLDCTPDDEGNTHYEYIIRRIPLATPTISADDPDATYPWTDKTPSDFQSNIAVVGSKITGTLKFIEGGLSPSGPLSGDGYFLALKFSDIDPDATSVKVGLDPSQGTGLVELDEDLNAVMKITSKNSQVFKTVITDGVRTTTRSYNISNLVLQNA